jgi:6-phosphofructokinase 1
MGNKSGYIAMEVALAAGAEDVIIPERTFDYEAMYKEITEGNHKGKITWIVVVAEGAGKAQIVADTITKATGLETRCAILGHVQRGGTPSGQDRILATRLGAASVDLLMNGIYGKAVGVLQDEINVVDLADATKRQFTHMEDYYQLLKILT